MQAAIQNLNVGAQIDRKNDFDLDSLDQLELVGYGQLFPFKTGQPLPNQSGRFRYRRGYMPGLWSQPSARLGSNLVCREERQPTHS